MISCLENLVGIKGCGQPVPETGVYINTLVGVTIKQMQRIADNEQQNYLGVWKDAKENASAIMYADFQNYLNYYFKVNCCADNCDVEEIFCNYSTQLAIPFQFLLGVMIMNQRIFSDRLNYFTTVGKEEAEELKAFYQVQYEKYLKGAVKAIPQGILNGCFECTGGKLTYQLNLP